MIRQYPAFIHKDLDSDYGVSFPDFLGCVTAGTTLEEAWEFAQEALQLCVDEMLDAGEPIPEPTSLERAHEVAGEEEAMALWLVPARLPGKAKRINVTIDEHLLEEIDRAAETRGMSRSAFLADGARILMKSA